MSGPRDRVGVCLCIMSRPVCSFSPSHHIEWLLFLCFPVFFFFFVSLIDWLRTSIKAPGLAPTTLKTVIILLSWTKTVGIASSSSLTVKPDQKQSLAGRRQRHLGPSQFSWSLVLRKKNQAYQMTRQGK